jgi:hypothetical protein
MAIRFEKETGVSWIDAVKTRIWSAAAGGDGEK